MFHIVKVHRSLSIYSLYKLRKDKHNYPYLDKLHTGTLESCEHVKQTLTQTEERKAIIRRYKARKVYKPM